MHVITEESEAADILPLRHMFLCASSFPELIIKCFERRRKKKKKNPEKPEAAAPSVLSLLKGQARFTSACIAAWLCWCLARLSLQHLPSSQLHLELVWGTFSLAPVAKTTSRDG